MPKHDKWAELKEFKRKYDAARSKNEMLRKYLGYIRNKYSYRDIFIAMEKAGFDTPICEGIHKLMFYNVDDLGNWEFIESVLKEKEQQILRK